MGKKAKVIDPLAAVKAHPAKVTRLSLNPAAARNAGKGIYDPLPAFPVELLGCKNLVELEIYRGLVDGRIPAELGGLSKLVQLSIGGLDTKALPATIGELAKLEKLELAYMSSLAALPDSIGTLGKLRELSAPYAGLTTLPKAVGKLVGLRVLTLANTPLTSVPAELWQVTGLEELCLPATTGALPRGIGALANLRALTLSPAALESIAGELGMLKSLEALHVVGDYSGTSATALPEEVGELRKLETLAVGFLGLLALPVALGKLTKLATLEVGGNKLGTLIDALAELPALRVLDYAGNPIALAERREIDKLMKLPASQRQKRLAKVSAPAKSVVVKGAKPAVLGDVASINASLSLIIADAKVAKAWRGVGDDDPDESDWERARQALARKDFAMVDVGKSAAVALSLGVGQGTVRAFKVGDRIVVVEAIADDDEDALFLEYVASEPKQARSVARLSVPSKKLVLVPTTDAGDGDEALTVDVPAKVSITIEPETKSSWGQGRRFFVTGA